jgi:hypothetical protein
MRLSDDRYESDRRKYALALSMIEHGARIQTVTRWTGLSKYRIQTLSQSYESATRTHRNRGDSPHQPAYFCKSLKIERESTALATIALQMQAIPDTTVLDARKSLPGLARGERLMSAFEFYCALLPEPLISLERAVLLIIELAERRTLILDSCESCSDVMVVDRLGRRHRTCSFCRPQPRPSTKPPRLLRQQQFHEGVKHDNHERAREGQGENEAHRKMRSVHQRPEKQAQSEPHQSRSRQSDHDERP